MKMRLPLLFALLGLTLSAIPVMAGTIYDNGGPNGSLVGWNISTSVVSNTVFCAGPGCIPNDLEIWIIGDTAHPLPTVSSFVWSFSTLENGGTGLGSGIADAATGLTVGPCTKSVPAVCAVFTNLVPLSAGVRIPGRVSWLNLSAAVGPGSDVLWNENGGISAASTVIGGHFVEIPSEAFNVSGTTVVPEPSGMLLLGSGVLGLAGVLRRKFRR